MYKGLLNYSRQISDEEHKYFTSGLNSLISFNQSLIHSVFVDTLCCLRRITENNGNAQSITITRLQTIIEREIKNRIPNNSEAKNWFDSLQCQHNKIIDEMEPLLTYIDKRICHY